MIRRPPRSTPLYSSAASDVYKRQEEQMTQRSKAYRAAAEKIDRTRLYAPLEAIRLAKQTSTTTYDATLEVAFRLGVDPRKADHLVRLAGVDTEAERHLEGRVVRGGRRLLRQPDRLERRVQPRPVDLLRGGAVGLAALCHLLFSYRLQLWSVGQRLALPLSRTRSVRNGSVVLSPEPQY